MENVDGHEYGCNGMLVDEFDFEERENCLNIYGISKVADETGAEQSDQEGP